MPCKEMMELEASFHRYVERRRRDIAPNQERRTSAEGFRAGEAKFAYILLRHRQNCLICRN